MHSFKMRSLWAISLSATIVALSAIVLLVSDCASPPPTRIPHITSLNPSSASVGGPAFTLTITGTGFDSSSSVSWNHSVRNTTLQSATSILATINTSDIANFGVANVSVVNVGGSGPVTSNALDFPIN